MGSALITSQGIGGEIGSLGGIGSPTGTIAPQLGHVTTGFFPAYFNFLLHTWHYTILGTGGFSDMFLLVIYVEFTCSVEDTFLIPNQWLLD